MKIISSFKDYYDYIAHTLFCGGDKKIVYLRKELSPSSLEIRIKSDNDLPSLRISPERVSKKYLVVCGYVYPLISLKNQKTGSSEPFRLLTKNDMSLILSEESYFFNRQRFEHSFAVKSITAEEISKQIQQPVFIISHISIIKNNLKYSLCSLEKRIPSLEKIGFMKIKSPEILFQDVYSYISNVLRENPDVKPPVEVANENKITAAGFDIKKS